jgi:hypothetical protein
MMVIKFEVVVCGFGKWWRLMVIFDDYGDGVLAV